MKNAIGAKEGDSHAIHSRTKGSCYKKTMIPPHTRSISRLTIEEGISDGVLYKWRQACENRRHASTAQAYSLGGISPSVDQTV